MPYMVDSPDFSHSGFQIFPSNANDPSLSTCKFDTVSRWALISSWDNTINAKLEARANLYYSLSSLTGAASLRGHMFEIQVLNYLDVIEAEHPFTICRLINSVQKEWLYRGPIPRFTFTKDILTVGIAHEVQTKVPVHLVPINRNQAAVDSILYDPNDLHKLIYIQITKNTSHLITVSGLKFIQSQLKCDIPLAGLHSSKANPWRFIFVVSSLDMESTFNLQMFHNDTPHGEWASKVQ